MILPSHKVGIEYLEHCRVVAADDRLAYVRKECAYEKYWAIPHANTAALLLGPGTSLTQQAARLLGSQGVMVAFCGGGGVPVYLGALNEYRATHHLQDWVRVWQSEALRLEGTRVFQRRRIRMLDKAWRKLESLDGFAPSRLVEDYLASVESAASNQDFLTAEALFTKALYRLCAGHYRLGDFKRDELGGDTVNSFLTQGNYLCYGLAASVLWVLGIPHSMPLNHGQTRRGALVFDLADVVKNACVTPLAFEAATQRLSEAQFRARCIRLLDDVDALLVLFRVMAETTALGTQSGPAVLAERRAV